MTRRRWLGRDRCSGPDRLSGRDRGSFTAETAAGLPALIVLLVAGLGAVNAASTKLTCLDAAREGAVAAARGEPGGPAAERVAPAGATVDVALSGDTVVVTVSAELRVLGAAFPEISVQATAVAAREPGGVP